MERLLELACGRGAREVFVLTDESSRAATAFYEPIGGRRGRADDVVSVFPLD